MIKKFVNTIDLREKLVKSHFGDNMINMLSFPDERKWYNSHVLPLDKIIVVLAKKILPNEKFDSISDVYSNAYLQNEYKKFKTLNIEISK